MRKISRSWRVSIAVLADIICVLAIGGLQFNRVPGSYYFRISRESLTPAHIVVLVVVLYLSVVAISGQWLPFKRGRSSD